jgi:hypothetical protein
MANVPQQSAPAFLFSQRLSTYVSSYLWVRPHRGALRKIIEAMTAKYKPGSFEDWDFLRGMEVIGHSSSLPIRAGLRKDPSGRHPGISLG